MFLEKRSRIPYHFSVVFGKSIPMDLSGDREPNRCHSRDVSSTCPSEASCEGGRNIHGNPRAKLGISEYFSRTRNLEYDSIFPVVLELCFIVPLRRDTWKLPHHTTVVFGKIIHPSVVFGALIPMREPGDPKHLPQDLILYPFIPLILFRISEFPNLHLCEESETPSLRGACDEAIQDSISSRLCEESATKQSRILKKSSNYRVFSLSRPGAKHPGPPQDFLGRKSFAETERDGPSYQLIGMSFLAETERKDQSFSSLRGVCEGNSGIPAPHESRLWNVFMYCIQRS